MHGDDEHCREAAAPHQVVRLQPFSKSRSLLSLPVPPQRSLVVRFQSILCHWTFRRPPTLDKAPAPHWSVMVKSWIYSQAKMLSTSTSPLSPWLPSLWGQPEASREKSIALSLASMARLYYTQGHASPGETVCNGAENIDRTQRKCMSFLCNSGGVPVSEIPSFRSLPVFPSPLCPL